MYATITETTSNTETPAPPLDPGADPGVLRQRLAALYEPIAADLALAERAFRDELGSKVPHVEALVERAEGYRGKRLRPALVLLAARACGDVRPEHHALAAVVEMIHVATLVHDDVLDEADLRRHVATVNAEWGNESAVLLGDYLFTHAFHLAAGTGSALACRLIGRATNRVCEGELHQVSRRGHWELTRAEYDAIIDGKTAELLACSCRLGAHYAGADESISAELEAFGRDLGMAFQIADDLIDVLGSEAEAGKTVGSDLRMRKLTLPFLHFRDTAPPERVERMKKLFEEPENASRDQVRELLATTDSLEFTRRTAVEFATRAAGRLERLPWSPARRTLATLCRLVVERMA
jgi:octaprenyl-diphosphate synthase